MSFDNGPRDGQPYPHPIDLGRVEGLEHFVPIALANSDNKIKKMDERRYKLVPAKDIRASQNQTSD